MRSSDRIPLLLARLLQLAPSIAKFGPLLIQVVTLYRIRSRESFRDRPSGTLLMPKMYGLTVTREARGI